MFGQQLVVELSMALRRHHTVETMRAQSILVDRPWREECDTPLRAYSVWIRVA